MKQIWIRKNGGAEVLSLEDVSESSQLSPNELLIDVHYSGINFADIVMRLGLYKDAPKLPYVPGYEVSGKVLQVGSAVRRFKVGDAVVAGTLFGGYASQVKVSEEMAFTVPSHLTLAEAAALPVTWITAHAALHDMGRVRKGDRVLVDSATGGVGTMALQMLRFVGAETVGLTGSPEKFEYIRSLGAKPLLHSDFLSDRTCTGFDLILNSQGGSSVREHYNRLAVSGRVVAFGMSSAIHQGRRSYVALLKLVATMPWFSLISMFDKNRGIFALNALKLIQDPIYQKKMQTNWSTVETQSLRPHISRQFPAAEVASAHRLLESRQSVGKVLLSWK